MGADLIIAAINAGITLKDLAMKWAADLKQSGELDEAGEKALDAKIANLSDKPWWKPQT